VSSDKQTLILAGEAVPRRDLAGASANEPGASATGSRLQRVTIIATRSDAMLLVQGEYAANPRALPADSAATGSLIAGRNDMMLPAAADLAYPAAAANIRTAYPSSHRGASSAAAAYARTQDLPHGGTRKAIIDTYA
jgi:hypothetical protein